MARLIVIFALFPQIVFASDALIPPNSGSVQSDQGEPFNDYASEQVKSFEKGQYLRKTVATLTGASGNLFLIPLGIQMSDRILSGEAKAFTYFVGFLSYAPVAYITSKLIEGELSKLQDKFSASSLSKQLWQKKNCARYAREGAEWALGAIIATSGVYYSNVYFNETLGQSIWVLAIPTAVAQTILGKKAFESLVVNLSQPLLHRMPCTKDDYALRGNVDAIFTQAIREVKNLSDIDANALLESLKDGNFSTDQKMIQLFKQPESTAVSSMRLNDYIVSGMGGVVGIIGSVAMINVTQAASQWALESCGVPTEQASPMAQAAGYIGGIGFGGFKGMGSKETFKKLSNYFKACFGRGERSTCRTKTADAIAGVFAFLGTASRAEIVTQASISSPILANMVMACNLISTTSNDFFGWQGMLNEWTEVKTSKATLVKALSKMKTEIVKDGNQESLKRFLKLVDPQTHSASN